jgi:hypothetical protein
VSTRHSQLISGSFDGIVSRHLCGLGAPRFIEVKKRAAELATSTETALRIGAVLRSKQAKWGYNLPLGKKSKMEVVERQTHNLAEFEVNEVSCTRSNSFLLKGAEDGSVAQELSP